MVGPARRLFDDENLVSCAGLVPVMALAERTGLSAGVDGPATIPPRVDLDDFCRAEDELAGPAAIGALVQRFFGTRPASPW